MTEMNKMNKMEETKSRIFTSGILLNREGKIFIMKRSPTAPRHPNAWDTLGGYLKDEKETAEECMLREAKEECGLDVRIKKAGKVYEYFDEYGRAIAIPFLLESDSEDVKLSFEHTEFKWINPKEITDYEIVQDGIEDVKIFGLV